MENRSQDKISLEKENTTSCKNSQCKCPISNGQRLTLILIRWVKYQLLIFYGASGFPFHCRENNAKSLSLSCKQSLFDSEMDIHGYSGELANYLKGEANHICSDLSLYSELFSFCIAKWYLFQTKEYFCDMCKILVCHCDTTIYVNQLNVYFLTCLSKSCGCMEINFPTHRLYMLF